MSRLKWDQSGERTYETGVDRGVLYVPNANGVYDTGFVWNGLVSVSESPTGAEANAQYADNIKYLNLISREEFGATIEAFTYPDEFAQFDGSVEMEPGVLIGQQNRGVFGLAYRTQVGDDLVGTQLGYKLHLIYNAMAAPTSKDYGTVNESPEALTFSWELTTTPVNVTDAMPTATLVIDSTKVDAGKLADFEDILYGVTAVVDPVVEAVIPSLPLPDAVIAHFAE